MLSINHENSDALAKRARNRRARLAREREDGEYRQGGGETAAREREGNSKMAPRVHARQGRGPMEEQRRDHVHFLPLAATRLTGRNIRIRSSNPSVVRETLFVARVRCADGAFHDYSRVLASSALWIRGDQSPVPLHQHPDSVGPRRGRVFIVRLSSRALISP